MLSKLESGFFEGKGVSDIALRLAHDVPPDPNNPLNVPVDPSEAYLKLLARYEAQNPLHEETLTVGDEIADGDVFTITLDGGPDSVEFEAGMGGTVPTTESVVAGLVDAWNATFGSGGTDIITAVSDSPDITLTANTMGLTFTATLEMTHAVVETVDEQTLTVGGIIEEGDVFTITLDGGPDSVEFEAGMGGTVPTTESVVAGLVDAWNATFGSGGTDIITAVSDSPDITLTANVAGEAFIVELEVTNADDDVPTFDIVTTTPASSSAITVSSDEIPDPVDILV